MLLAKKDGCDEALEADEIALNEQSVCNKVTYEAALVIAANCMEAAPSLSGFKAALFP